MVEPAACAVHAACAADDRRRRAGRRARRRDPRALRDRGAASTSACRARSSPSPSTPTSASSPASSAPTRSSSRASTSEPPAGCPARSPSSPPTGDIERLTGGVDLVVDCVGTLELARSSASRSCAPGAGSCSSACPASCEVDLAPLWQREIELAAPTLMAPRTDPKGHGRPSSSPSSSSREARLERLVSARYPLERYEDAVAPRRRRRAARRGEDRVRPAQGRAGPDAPTPRPRGTTGHDDQGGNVSPRPGFVLEVDRSTPPTLIWHGEGFRLERLPVGTRVVYAPEPLAPLADPDRRSATPSSTRSATPQPLSHAAVARACGSRSPSTTSRCPSRRCAPPTSASG